jgi:iron only hydrogenase large subunit-like protein
LDPIFHSVTLRRDWCKGCTNCLKRCPTEAIRVRKGKAEIMSDRCIDCGECIRVCPHHAKKAVYDSLDVLDKFEYTIALPAPSLYGQFTKLKNINVLLNALLALGFDDVFEVATAAEIISDATRKFIEKGDFKKPIISSACPTITRLIQMRFPDLIDNILPIITPAELAGYIAKQNAMKKTGLSAEKIGTVFISPCPAKVTTVANPLGSDQSNLDAAIAIKEIYPKLLNIMKAEKANTALQKSGGEGIRWGSSGGEALATNDDQYLAADGIENCIRVLEKLEDDKFSVDFVELNACPGGCVGGVLTVQNPFIASAKLKQLRKGLPPSRNGLKADSDPNRVMWNQPVTYKPVMQLDDDLAIAMEKMVEIDRITESLRGLDCGSCGSPSCHAFAEDIVRGYCEKDECIFVLKETMHDIAQQLAKLSSIDAHSEPWVEHDEPEEDLEL